MARIRFKDQWAAAEQDKDLSTVGGRLRWSRLVLGMTQADVADALPDDPKRKKSRAMIAAYETGNPPVIDVIEDLAAVLEQTPAFLAFGGLPEAGLVARGQQVLVRPADDLEDEEYAVLPRTLLEKLGASKRNLVIARLALDAPSFGVRSQDHLLLDAGCSTVAPDGRLYAVNTSAGIALVRGEPQFSRDAGAAVQLTGGQGANYSVPPESLEVLGQLIATLQRRG